MAEAIKHKTIPIFYSSKKVLFFDAIEPFSSIDFKYLKETNDFERENMMSSHKIEFKKYPEIMSNTNIKTPLMSLVRKLFDKAEKGLINFGVPIFMSEGKSKYHVSANKLPTKLAAEYLWSSKIQNLPRTLSPPIASYSSLGPRMIEVGQGLCFVDNRNCFMFDAGSGEDIPYADFKSRVGSGIFDLVISHMHIDHYRFMKQLKTDGIVRLIYLPEHFYAGEVLREFLDNHPFDIIQVDDSLIPSVGPYKIYRPSTRATVDLNRLSLIVKGNNWILNGDSSWGIIFKTLGAMTESNIQVPHHGSNHNGKPKAKMFLGSKDFFVSYGIGNRYGHPHSGLSADLAPFGSLTEIKI